MESKEDESIELTNERFDDLDIDPKTKKVLRDKGYLYLTKVQSKVLPLALQGKNLVIQSPTGSGKTLCFLLPAIKLLNEEGYSGNLPADANLLGCISLAPTRELASQSAIQMRDLANPLKLNAGCCIGGIRDKYDKMNAHRLHILTGTPGRVSALISSQAIPDTSNIKLLNEADRLLDSGFRDSILEIVDQLPTDVQILLFSATIKSSLKNLCSVILNGTDYEMICLKADADVVSDSKLRQEYLCVPERLKVTSLYFILSKNQNKRIIVFLPTCKQVRFFYEVFKRLIPAIPMTELHGKQSQMKRMEQFTRFAAKQNFGCIFTSDVTARGIDFPSVDLVLQIDLPDTVQTYIHRIGRAGRLSIEGVRNFGRGIIFISEPEIVFIHDLKRNGITLHDQTKLMLPLITKREDYLLRKLQSLLAKEAWIKEMAQRSVIAYLRYLNTRSVKLSQENLIRHVQDFALSLGLPSAPKIQVEPGTYTKGPTTVPLAVEDSSNYLSLKSRATPRDRGEAPEADLSKIEEVVTKKKKSKLDKFKKMRKDKKSVVVKDECNMVPETSDVFVLKDGLDEDLVKSMDIIKESREDKVLKSSLTSSRKRLRLNRRGDAKLRGVYTLNEVEENHKFFSDDDEGFDDKDYKRQNKERYINEIKEALNEKRDEDKLNEAHKRINKRNKSKHKTK